MWKGTWKHPQKSTCHASKQKKLRKFKEKLAERVWLRKASKEKKKYTEHVHTCSISPITRQTTDFNKGRKLIINQSFVKFPHLPLHLFFTFPTSNFQQSSQPNSPSTPGPHRYLLPNPKEPRFQIPERPSCVFPKDHRVPTWRCCGVEGWETDGWDVNAGLKVPMWGLIKWTIDVLCTKNYVGAEGT